MEASKQVYPQGRVELTLLANQYLAVSSIGKVQVFQKVGFPNEPAVEQPVTNGAFTGGEVVLGPFASGGTFVIYANAAPVAYAQGIATPRVIANAASQLQGTPGVLNATGTLTGAMIASGIVTTSTAAAVAGTLDTGTVLDTILPDMQIGESFDFSIINTGGNTFTLTNAASGTSIVGVATVLTASSASFRCRKTAAATYVFYRMTGN